MTLLLLILPSDPPILDLSTSRVIICSKIVPEWSWLPVCTPVWLTNVETSVLAYINAVMLDTDRNASAHYMEIPSFSSAHIFPA